MCTVSRQQGSNQRRQRSEDVGLDLSVQISHQAGTDHWIGLFFLEWGWGGLFLIDCWWHSQVSVFWEALRWILKGEWGLMIFVSPWLSLRKKSILWRSSWLSLIIIVVHVLKCTVLMLLYIKKCQKRLRLSCQVFVVAVFSSSWSLHCQTVRLLILFCKLSAQAEGLFNERKGGEVIQKNVSL